MSSHYQKKVPTGKTVNYSASKEGLVTEEGSFIMPNREYTLNIELKAPDPWTIFQTVDPTPDIHIEDKGGASLVVIGGTEYNDLYSPILKNYYDGNLTHIEYGNKYISTIDFLDSSYITDVERMFKDCNRLESIPELDIDMSEITSMREMFYRCQKLDIPILDTRNVTDMYQTFVNCNLESIPLMNYSNVTNAYGMFSWNNFQTLVVTDFSKVTTADYMFADCSSLTSISFANFAPETCRGLLSKCTNLQHIWGLDLTNAIGGVYDEYHSNWWETKDAEIFTDIDAYKRLPRNLVDLRLEGELHSSLYLQDCSNLNYESVKSILTAASKRTYVDDYPRSFTITFGNLTFDDPDYELGELVELCSEDLYEGGSVTPKFNIVGLTLNHLKDLARWSGTNNVSGGATATVSGVSRTVNNSPVKQATLIDTLDSISFANNTSIRSLDYLAQDNLQTFADMFSGCTNLETIPILDFTGITDATDMFSGCSNLKDLEISGELSTDLDLSDIEEIEPFSIKSILEAANRKSNLDPHTLTFASLTFYDAGDIIADLVASCESKNWTITGLNPIHINTWIAGTLYSSLLADPDESAIVFVHKNDPLDRIILSKGHSPSLPIMKSDYPDYNMTTFRTDYSRDRFIYGSGVATITCFDAGYCSEVSFRHAQNLESIDNVYGLEYHPEMKLNFHSCRSLESIGNMNTRTVVHFDFSECTSLIEFPELDTRSARGINFTNCSNLETVPNLDCSRARGVHFEGCGHLANLGRLENFGKWLEEIVEYAEENPDSSLDILEPGTRLVFDLNYCPLTTESLHNLAESLYDIRFFVEGYIRHYEIRLNPDIEDNLTSEDRALLSSKGWSVRFY